MPRTRPQRADVRAEVLAAAREEFAEHGYHRAGLDRIAARAGYSKGAVYSNFAGKQGLFLELLADEAERMGDEVVARPPQAGADDGLRVLAAGLLDLAGDGVGQLVLAEFRATAARDPALAAELAAVRDRVATAVAARLETEMAARGATLAVEPREAATLVLALTNGLALEQAGQPRPLVSVDALARLLRGLVAPRPDPVPTTTAGSDHAPSSVR